jgi:RNA polymerase sigma-70 factor (ECF subfamily)
VELALMAETLNSEKAEAAAPDAHVWIIARAQSGDRAAFDQLMIQHQRRVVALAWRLLGTQDDARDAAQEAFLRVYKHLHKYDPAQDFNGWLYRIVINVCRDLQRKRGRHAGASFEEELETGKLVEPASQDDSETKVLLAQERALLQRALAVLSEKERQAVVLRDLEGLPTEEVARLLGSTPTTVRSQISMARVKLKAFREKWLKGKRAYTGNERPQ